MGYPEMVIVSVVLNLCLGGEGEVDRLGYDVNYGVS
jgi:hypothetical protein